MDRRLLLALIIAGAFTVLGVTVVATQRPEVFTRPWTAGFDKIYTDAWPKLMEVCKTMFLWGSNVFKISIAKVPAFGFTLIKEAGFLYRKLVRDLWRWYFHLSFIIIFFTFAFMIFVLAAVTIIFLIIPIGAGLLGFPLIAIAVVAYWAFGILVYLATAIVALAGVIMTLLGGVVAAVTCLGTVGLFLVVLVPVVYPVVYFFDAACSCGLGKSSCSSCSISCSTLTSCARACAACATGLFASIQKCCGTKKRFPPVPPGPPGPPPVPPGPPIPEPIIIVIDLSSSVWEAEVDGVWISYQTSIQALLENAHSRRAPVSFSLSTGTYTVDWAKMVQVNTASKVTRPIRRRQLQHPPAAAQALVTDVDDDSRQQHVWEAEIDGKWTLYEAKVQRKLENAHSTHAPVFFRLGGNAGGAYTAYTVDWATMVQVNTASKVTRPIRRRKLDSMHTRWRAHDEELDATYGAVKFCLKDNGQSAITTFGPCDQYHFAFAISQVFHKNQNAKFKVRSVDLILNPLVESRFNSMKEQFSSEGKNTSVEIVFHGTLEPLAAKIAKEGFKIGGVNVGVRTGAIHGQGIYTDSKPDDPFKYATPSGVKDPKVTIILAFAIKGKWMTGHTGSTAPEGYDTWSPTSEPTWCIFRNECQLLPMYVIHCDLKPG